MKTFSLDFKAGFGEGINPVMSLRSLRAAWQEKLPLSSPIPQTHCPFTQAEHCKSYKRHTKQLPTQTQQKNSPKMSLQVSMDKNQVTPSALCGCDHLALLELQVQHGSG